MKERKENMEYVLKNKKKDMYIGTNNKFVKEKTQAVILDRKGVSEKLKTVQNPDEWELMVIHDKDKLTEDDKILNMIHMNHKKEYEKELKKIIKDIKLSNTIFIISLIFFIISLCYFISVVYNYVG